MSGKRIDREYYEKYWSILGYDPCGSMYPGLERLYRKYIPSDASCLDVGCGDGGTSGIWLKKHGCIYVGVDISENAIREAIKAGLDARKIDDASALPFADGTFEAVVCIEVVEHLFLPHLAVAEIFRVLKPGGVFVMTVPNVAYWRRRVDLTFFGRWNPFGDNLAVAEPWRDPHIRFFTVGSLSRFLGSVGFCRMEVGAHGGAFLRDIPLLRRLHRAREASFLYRSVEKALPSFFGARLHGIGHKPK